MALLNLTASTFVAFVVVGLFVVSVIFFILNKLGFVRNEEPEEM